MVPGGYGNRSAIEVIVAEFIREKILRTFRDEVPHSIGVTIEHMEYEKKKDLNRILARIYVERDSQKGIIIGKGGSAIKRIGQEAQRISNSCSARALP